MLGRVILLATLVSGKYTPDWDSLDSRPLPTWYDEAKIGIFMHFGVFTVPAVESAWFWMQTVRNESESDRKCIKYLKDYFPPKFTYQDFGPMLTMEFFNASEIADIVAASGAKYFVFTTKHHEGFCNWPSTYSFGWNSMAIGPKRNVVGELKTAFQINHPDVHFGLYYSLFEFFNPIYMKDRSNNFTTRDYVLNKMLPEMKELIQTFAPDVLWSDGDWEASPEYFASKEFLAWLYNESPSKDTIVTNDRWGIGTSLTHGDFFSGPDRFSPGELVHHKWENAMTVDRLAWTHRKDIKLSDILSPLELILEVAKTVSCGGNILINVGPNKEGKLLPTFEERLRQLGAWLKVNGDAIYGTRPWHYQNDTSNPDVWYTQKGSTVYAIALGWPENDLLRISAPAAVYNQTKISLLGYQGELKYSILKQGLKIGFPSMSKLMLACGSACQWGYVLKLDNLHEVKRRVNDINEIN